jgi:hypothetical protein
MLKKILFRFAVFLGISWMALFFSACQSASAGLVATVTATNSPVLPSATSIPPTLTLTASPEVVDDPPLASPTSIPTETLTPTPTATPTPRGALTWDQEERLYRGSLNFLADNPEDATVVVRDHINYLQSNAEDPSLACGPISAAILRDAGLLPPDTDVHGFWLLDPRTRTSQIILETYFPPEHYQWYEFDVSTTEFDFQAFPLLPGDFIYLYAGSHGTFEHIITVTRVDEAGRAYTVSNLHTEEGFVIRELMLYDPNQPGVGQFYDWMNRELNGMLGMTGDGGFDLWRPLAPVQDYVAP